MAKLRKMMGDINAKVIQSLMALIETQSVLTLSKWALTFVQNHILDIYVKAYPEETKVSHVISASMEYLDGTRTLKEVKALIKEVNQIARETEENLRHRLQYVELPQPA